MTDTTTTTTTTADQTQQTQQQAQAPWFATHPDEAVRTWAGGKAFPDANAALQAAYHSERMLGLDRAGRTVVLPKDATDAEGIKAFRSKLGVPDAPEGYELPVPEGDDGKFAEAMRPLLHKHGVPKDAAKALAADFNALQAKMREDMAAEEAAFLQQEEGKLKAAWGNAYPHQMELAKRAGQLLGLSEETTGRMLKVAETAQALAKAAKGLGEHPAFGMDTNHQSSFTMTPQQAQARIQQLHADAGWRAKAMVPGSAEWAEQTRLNQILADHAVAQTAQPYAAAA